MSAFWGRLRVDCAVYIISLKTKKKLYLKQKREAKGQTDPGEPCHFLLCSLAQMSLAWRPSTPTWGCLAAMHSIVLPPLHTPPPPTSEPDWFSRAAWSLLPKNWVRKRARSLLPTLRAQGAHGECAFQTPIYASFVPWYFLRSQAHATS